MKKFLKILGGSVLSLAIVVASCFIPIKMKQSNNSLNSASASTSSILPSVIPDLYYPLEKSFYSRSFFVPFVSCISSNTLINDFSSYLQNNSGILCCDFMQFDFNLQIGSDNFFLQYSAIRSNTEFIVSKMAHAPSSSMEYMNTISFPSFSFSSLETSFSQNSIFISSQLTPMQIFYDNGSTKYVNFGLEIYKNNTNVSEFVKPTFDMVSIEILNSYEFSSKFNYEPSYSNSNIIRFSDTSGYSFSIYLPSFVNLSYLVIPSSNYYFSYNKYLLPSYFNLDDNSIYQQGVTDGYANGYNVGQTEGYKNGFNVGEDEGFTAGYVEGLNTADEFTFFGLISAVVDAPLKTFSGLFDFEILGVNLEKFFYALLTFCVVILIFKIALGGK